MSSKVWDEIIYTFPNFNSCTVDVWKWISNFIPHFMMDVITYLVMFCQKVVLVSVNEEVNEWLSGVAHSATVQQTCVWCNMTASLVQVLQESCCSRCRVAARCGPVDTPRWVPRQHDEMGPTETAGAAISEFSAALEVWAPGAAILTSTTEELSFPLLHPPLCLLNLRLLHPKHSH